MRRCLTVLALAYSCAGFAQGGIGSGVSISQVEKIDPTGLKTRVQLTKTMLENLFSKQQQTETDYAERLKIIGRQLQTDTIQIVQQQNSTIAKQLAAAQQLAESRENALDQRLAALEAYNRSSDSIKHAEDVHVFEVCKDAAKNMKQGAKYLSFSQKLCQLAQACDLTTNIWADSSLRNTWDEIGQWGTVAGLIVGALTIGGNSSGSSSTAAIGIGVSGLSSLAGLLFGSSTSGRAQSTMKFIDLTRRAYDDLQTRAYLLQKYIDANASFVGKLNDYENDLEKRFAEGATTRPTSVDTLKAIRLCHELYVQYEVVLNQIPAYVEQMQSMTKELVMQAPMPDTRQKLQKVVADATTLLQNYETDIKPGLELSEETKAILARR